MLPQQLRFLFHDYFDERGQTLPGRVLRVEGHAHTDHTDGYSPARECVARAVALGLDILVFAEHMRAGAPWRDAYFDEVEKLKAEHQGRLDIVCGVEVRAMGRDGSLDADEVALDRAEVVVGSVHGFWGTEQGTDNPFARRSDARTLDMELGFLHGLVSNERVDVLGHAFGTYFERFGRPPSDMVQDLARHAAAVGKAVEINARHMDVAWFAKRLAGVQGNLLFLPASDAHQAGHVGRAAQALFPNAFPGRKRG